MGKISGDTKFAFLVVSLGFGLSGGLGYAATGPSLVSVTPSSGGGASASFVFVFTDPNGGANVSEINVLINNQLSIANGCDVDYTSRRGILALASNDGSTTTTGSLGGSGTLQNNQCTLSLSSATFVVNGNSVTLTLPLTFSTTFAGLKNIYTKVYDQGGAFQDFTLGGTWTAGGSSTTGPPTGGTNTVASCQEIAQSGNYILTGNLPAPTGLTVCLDIHDTSNVQLDCQQFSVAGNSDAITVTNVDGFTLKNCKVTGSGPELLSVSNSPKGNILNDAFAAAANSTSEVTVDSSDGLSVTGSTFSATLLVVTNTNGATITGNTFNLEDFVGFAAGISITGGTGSSIENNSITDIGTPVTVSDGIFARSIGNAAIEGNTVKNVTNCGVETAGLITNVQISNNGITNAGTCGIGAWEDSSWQNNTVASNTATNVPLLFDFFRLDGLETGESAVYFENNNFTNNKLVSQPVLPQTPAWVVMNSTGNNVPSGDFVLGNNVFTGNNFLATGLLPTFVPTSMIVDGGGNICNAAAATNAFPLVCGGSGSPNPPPGPDTQAPTVPTLISAIAVSPTQVNLIWSQSTDNVGVAGYQITRNGLVLTSVTGATTLTYSDTTVLNYTPYTYSVKAFDAAKNYSNASNSIQVTTPRR